jgi:hypothetical protein|tara:strand:+ start:351 stop:1007 length:657 start_codon:yes stop_codon:yes gene_type:complete
MDYAELKTQIQNITENTFDDVTLAMFTKQAEQKIYNAVQVANLSKNVNGVLTTANPYLSCPTDFLSSYSLAVYPASGTGDFVYLVNKDENFIREAYPNQATTGQPKYYAIFGPQSANVNELSFIIGPTPDANYNAELNYYYYPESIVTAGTSWLGNNFDSALLNGALIEALRYMKAEQADFVVYEKLYTQSLGLLKQLGDGKQRRDAYRNGQYRMPVT